MMMHQNFILNHNVNPFQNRNHKFDHNHKYNRTPTYSLLLNLISKRDSYTL